MLVKELRLRLDEFEKYLSRWGAKASELADFRRLLQALSACDELTIAEVCARLENTASSGTAEVGNRSKRSSGKVDYDVVVQYVSTLSATGLDRPTFTAIIEELKASKVAKTAEVTAIANQLAGTSTRYKNRISAIEKIEEVVRRRLDTARGLEGTSGIF